MSTFMAGASADGGSPSTGMIGVSTSQILSDAVSLALAHETWYAFGHFPCQDRVSNHNVDLTLRRTLVHWILAPDF